MGVPISNPGSNRENCPKISTACVIWQGPDIPCINLCAGDAIDEVVYKLATLLCDVSSEMVDITQLDYTCLLPTPQSIPPDNFQELVQLLINSVCAGGATPELLSFPIDPSGEPILPLPVELYYVNEDGDVVTELVQSEYNVYLAQRIVDNIININNQYSQIDLISARVTDLQTQVDALPSTPSTSDIYVISQCASSFTPNTLILIQEAFYNFERTFCNLSGVLGTPSSLTTAIGRQIPSLANLPQLLYPSLFMKDMSGWVMTPNTIADSFSNLWLTMQDLRYKVEQYLNSIPTDPCILVGVEDYSIAPGITYGALSWSVSSVSGIQSPILFEINVYQVADTLFASPIYTKTVNFNTGVDDYTYNILSAAFIVNTVYNITVTSVYSCGSSNRALLNSVIIVPSIGFLIQANTTPLDTVPLVCTDADLIDTPYTRTRRSLAVRMVNASTGLPAVNTLTVPIDVVIRLLVYSCAYAGMDAYEDILVSIPVGDYEVLYTYVSEDQTVCIDGTCGPLERDIDCGISISYINAQFDPAYISPCEP
jgi:hypothetical protein